MILPGFRASSVCYAKLHRLWGSLPARLDLGLDLVDQPSFIAVGAAENNDP